VVDAGGGAEGKGAGPGGDEALRVGVRHPGVSSVCPRPVVVELSHASQSRSFFCGEASRSKDGDGFWKARDYGIRLGNRCFEIRAPMVGPRNGIRLRLTERLHSRACIFL
jgi:hypothetical protein